jgi:sugar (pentulose or hexulose) kinase
MVATAGGDEGPCFEGLSSEPEHLVRAALEHIVFSISEMVVMARAHGLIAGDQRVIVSGRLVRMPGLLEILARISGVAIGVSDRPADDGIESSSALGAAVLAVDRIRGKDRSEVHPSAQRAVQWINPDIGPRNVALEDRYRRWIGLRDRVVLRSE